jgi:hypothetical protein
MEGVVFFVFSQKVLLDLAEQLDPMLLGLA